MMRILQVCPRYYPDVGGVEEHVRNISERLARNHEVVVATTDPSGELAKEETLNGVRIVRFKCWAPGDAYYFSRDMKKYLTADSGTFDVVHAHSYHAFPALYAAQAKGTNKLVFTPHYHGTGHTLFRKALHAPYRFVGKGIFKKADRIICVSDFERKLVAKQFKLDPENIAIIPNGINLQDFQRLNKRANRTKTILCVSRLEKYKGIQYVVSALPKLENGIVLEVVGRGPYKDHLVGLAARLRVEDRVKFLEDLPRNELLQKYADAGVFVLLSKHEAYGMCVGEAIASKTPCIVSDSSALSEWIDNENCYGIKQPIVLEELADLITRVIGKKVEGMKMKDWDEVTSKLADLYQS